MTKFVRQILLLYILKYFINDKKDCPKSNPFFMAFFKQR